MPAINIQHITKTYDKGGITALNDVSIQVEKGELFGLIGPDGAGKSSLFRILTTLLISDKGTATVDGFDVVKDYKQIRGCVGYMPGKFSLYQDLTVEENLTFFASLFGTTISENYDLIKDIYIQIEPFKTRRAGKLSGGMKQKLALCCALIHKPTVLFLDEPTTGVDAVSRKEFWEMLKKLKAQQITIMVSTPYMDEANLCERIALIQEGKILSVNTPKNIVDAYPNQLYAVRADNMHKVLNDARNYENIQSAYAFGEYLHVSFKDEKQENETKLYDYLQHQNNTNVEIKMIEPTIEDSFIGLMNNAQI